MKLKDYKKFALVALIVSVLMVGSVGILTKIGWGWEGSTSFWTPGSFEEIDVNATGDFYRGGVNYTQWIDDTYLLDDGSETLDISGTFSATDINATNEFYRAGQNYTAYIESLIYTPPPRTYSFLVNESSGTYYAHYGDNGTVAFSGDNCSNIANWAIGNSSDGDTLIFKNGDYPISASITDHGKNDIELWLFRGAILTAVEDLNDNVIRLDSVSGWWIHGGEIDGNKTGQSGGTRVNGIDMEACSWIEISDMYVHDCKIYGISSEYNTDNWKAYNLRLENNGWNGIEAGNGDEYVEFYSLDVTGSSDVGIATYGTYVEIHDFKVWDINGIDGSNNSSWGVGVEKGDYVKVYDGIITTCDYGIGVYHDTATFHHVDIDNIQFIDCPEMGINPSSDVVGLSITRCSFEGIPAVKFGITLEGDITDSTISNNDFNGSTNYQAITAKFGGTISNSKISENQIYGSPSQSIQLDANCDDNFITLNDIEGGTGITIGNANCNDNVVLLNEGPDLIDSGTDTVTDPGVGSFGYIIENVDSIYEAYHGGNLSRAYSDTNATEVIEYAFSGLTSGRTWREKVVLLGNITIDTTIQVPSYTWIDGPFNISVESGFTGNIIENDDRTTNGNRGIKITNGIVDGQGQSSGNGIDFSCINTGSYWSGNEVSGLVIDNLHVENAHTHSLHLENYGSTTVPVHFISNSRFINELAGATAFSIYLNVSSDSWFDQLSITNMLIQGGGSNHFSNMYFGNGAENLEITSSSHHIFTNCRFDYASNTGIDIIGSNRVQFTGCDISRAGRSADNTYKAVRIRSGSDFTSFVGCKWYVQSGSNYPINCISEEDTSDYTTISGCTFEDYRGDPVILVGTNSYVDSMRQFANQGVARDKANGGVIAHGLVSQPTFVSLTSLNATYDGELVLVYWDEINTDSTNISFDIYWVNGTAIGDGVIDVSWKAKYDP